MQPTTFPYKLSLLRRRAVVNAVFALLPLVYFLIKEPATPIWIDGIVLTSGIYFSYQLARDVMVLARPRPTVTISDEGITDPHFGGMLVPWQAIKEIKATNPATTFGGSIFLIADRSKFDDKNLSRLMKIAPKPAILAGVIAPNTVACPMTPLIALEATMQDLLSAIALHQTDTDIAVHNV